MKCASLIGRFEENRGSTGATASQSLIAVAAAVKVFALQVSFGVVDAGDFHAEPVDAPADPPPPAARWLTLQAES